MKLIRNGLLAVTLLASTASIFAMEQTSPNAIIENDFQLIQAKQELSPQERPGRVNRNNNQLTPMTKIPEAGLSEAAKQALANYREAREEYTIALLGAPTKGRKVEENVYKNVEKAYKTLIDALSGRAVVIPPTAQITPPVTTPVLAPITTPSIPSRPTPTIPPSQSVRPKPEPAKPIIQPTPPQKEPSKSVATRANELIEQAKSKGGAARVSLAGLDNNTLQALAKYLESRATSEKGHTLGVYNLIRKQLGLPTLRSEPVRPTPQPTPAPQPEVSEELDSLIALLLSQPGEVKAEVFDFYTDEVLQLARSNDLIKDSPNLLRAIDEVLKKRAVRPPVREEVEEKAPTRTAVHLIDINRLNQLGLCPLFQGLDRETQAAYRLQNFADKCTKNIANNQTLMQLNTINQFALEGIGYATCPVQSLRSISLLMQYIQTGNQQFLHDLNDESNARRFVEGLTRKGFSTEWLTREWLEDVVRKANIQGLNQGQVTVLDNVLEVDPQYEGIFVVEENIANMRRVKQIVRDGLKQDNFVHAFVIGTSDLVQLTGGEQRIHFFAFLVAKKGNTIEYIVVDTAPATYHLGGYELKRLEYLIQLLTKGSTTINLQQEAQKQ